MKYSNISETISSRKTNDENSDSIISRKKSLTVLTSKKISKSYSKIFLIKKINKLKKLPSNPKGGTNSIKVDSSISLVYSSDLLSRLFEMKDNSIFPMVSRIVL